MGRCGGPCAGQQSIEEYAAVVERATAMIVGDSREVVGALRQRMSVLSGEERYEDAGEVRDRLLHLVRGAARAQRIEPLANSAEIVAARPAPDGGWEIISARFGRLAGTTLVPRGADPAPYIEALAASAENVNPSPGPAPSASAEETEKILRWLESAGVRIVSMDGMWTCPVHGAGAAHASLDPDSTAYHDVVDFDEPSSPGLRRLPLASGLAPPMAPSLTSAHSRTPAATAAPEALNAAVALKALSVAG